MEGITAENLWALLLAGASALVLLANAGEKVVKIVQNLKAPNANQDKRLDDLEEWKESVDGNRVTQRALLALLDHSIDGNNIKQMQAAKDELRSYLISR